MLRIHLVQFFYNLAFYDEYGSFLEEPHYEVADKNYRLGSLRRYSQVDEILTASKALYIADLKNRLHTILSWASSRGTHLVVFPEYSIPESLLPLLVQISKQLNIYIVAGSHRFRNDEVSIETYRSIGINHQNLLQGAAYVPVLRPRDVPLFVPKLSRSKWEIDLALPHEAPTVFELRIADQELEVSVFPCIDALNLGKLGEVFRNDPRPKLILCPSYSPTTEPFFEIAEVLGRQETLLAYSNHAALGHTMLCIPERLKPHFSDLSGAQYSVPRGEEAILEVEIADEYLCLTRGTVVTRSLGRAPRVYPLIYPGSNSWQQGYKSFQDEAVNAARTGVSIEAQLDYATEYLAESGSELPDTIVDRLRKLIREILPVYDGKSSTIEEVLQIIPLDGCIEPPILSSERVNSALKQLTGLFARPDFKAGDEFLGVLGNLKNYQAALPTSNVRARIPDHAALENPESAQADVLRMESFQNRGSELDRLRDAFRDASITTIFLTGPSGVGKSDLHWVFFRKTLPDWNPLVVHVPEGTGTPKLLAAIARAVGQDLDIDAVAEASSNVFRHRCLQVWKAFQGFPKTALVIDDIATILRSRNGRDIRLMQILIDASNSIDRVTENKLVIVSSINAPSSWTGLPKSSHVRLHQLDERYIERIIERDLRRLGKAGPTTEPKNLLLFTHLAGGHALAAKLIAEVAASRDIETLCDASLKDMVATRVAERMLDLVKLSEMDDRAMQILSIFRVPIQVQTLVQVGRLAVYLEQIKSLAQRVFLSYDDSTIVLHSVVRYYYHKKAESAGLDEEGHRSASEYFELLIRQKGRSESILECAELAHHLISLGEDARAIELRAFVIEEVKPVAKRKYRMHDYAGAFDLFRLLQDVSPYDPEVLAALARCHGRLGRWDDSRENFEKAIVAAKQRTLPYWWIYRDWGQLLARYDRTNEAEAQFAEAEKHFMGQNNPSLKATRGFLAAKEGNVAKAAKLYEEALALNPHHHYTLVYYSRLLRSMGQHEKASELQRTLDLIDINEVSDVEEFEIDFFDD